MKQIKTNSFFVFTTVLILSACSATKKTNINSTKVYSPVSKELYDTIAHMDSVLFNAFNARNLEKLKTFFSGDLEIYQDNVGVRSYKEAIEAFAGLFTKDYILKRELIKSSLEVYPIKDYGAIETGKHTFCHTENSKLVCGIFKFVHIWEKKGGQWKITRIVTYDH
jgi:hypothetical protein